MNICENKFFLIHERMLLCHFTHQGASSNRVLPSIYSTVVHSFQVVKVAVIDDRGFQHRNSYYLYLNNVILIIRSSCCRLSNVQTRWWHWTHLKKFNAAEILSYTLFDSLFWFIWWFTLDILLPVSSYTLRNKDT